MCYTVRCYLFPCSGNNYVESCQKAQVSMDDVLVGVVIGNIMSTHQNINLVFINFQMEFWAMI